MDAAVAIAGCPKTRPLFWRGFVVVAAAGAAAFLPSATGAGGADDGATAAHWAYRTPVRPVAPAVRDADWVRNPADAFVLARMESAGFSPEPGADRARLLRRASLALTGLPPTPAEVDAFLADARPGAYERLVDRLLASPRYGEHWARGWLDLARYADSNGFQADQLRDSWAFRDWVIDAFNRDMPFDRFTVEQIAGDLLPGATVAQRVATGFHRTPTCNVEAGVHPEENRVNQVVDRVNTTGTVWLGTTLECAQCHDHKYDPFSQEDYYRLFAYFNNTRLEVKQEGKGVTWNFYGPVMDLPPSPAQRREREDLEAEMAVAEAELAALTGRLAGERQAWEERAAAALEGGVDWRVLAVEKFHATGGATGRRLDDGSVLVGGPSPETSVYSITTTIARGAVAGGPARITALRLETLTDPSLPSSGPGRNHLEGRPNFVLNDLAASIQPAGAEDPMKLALRAVAASFEQPNYPASGAVDDDPKTAWAIAGQFSKAHWAIFALDEPLELPAEGGALTFTLTHNYGGGRTIGRPRLAAFSGDVSTLEIPDDIAAILAKPDGKRKGKERRNLEQFFTRQQPEHRRLKDRVADLRKRLGALEPETTLVMEELAEARPTHVMRRGNYLDPGVKVEPGTPPVLHPPPEGARPDRLGLARWLVDPANPLVARVAVNRWWAAFFGRGLVSSPEDFGTRSEPPSHPALLDWLAVEFVESGWSVKHIHRLIATSATFRQSAAAPEKRRADPDNRLLARGPRFRMTAEMVRDNALAIAGLLSAQAGGAPVYPPQPDGIWRHVGRNAPKYQVDTGGDRFRRGVYVVWRRSAPYPAFVNFDAPDRAACVVARPRTNTPLQALTLLNDPAYIEIAAAFARRVLAERPGAGVAGTEIREERLRYAFRLCLARGPEQAEVEVLRGLLERRLERFRADPSAARTLLDGAGRHAPPEGTDEPELAAWFYLATVLLNLDETITP